MQKDCLKFGYVEEHRARDGGGQVGRDELQGLGNHAKGLDFIS